MCGTLQPLLLYVLIAEYTHYVHTHKYCNVNAQSVSRQRLSKHIPVNTQQWKLCSLWAMLQLVAR
jgi:hypothetical protein